MKFYIPQCTVTDLDLNVGVVRGGWVGGGGVGELGRRWTFIYPTPRTSRCHAGGLNLIQLDKRVGR